MILSPASPSLRIVQPVPSRSRRTNTVLTLNTLSIEGPSKFTTLPPATYKALRIQLLWVSRWIHCVWWLMIRDEVT